MKKSKIPKPNPIYHYPDAKKHLIISNIKSAIRIAGYICLPFNLNLAVIILILSEVLGVVEELV